MVGMPQISTYLAPCSPCPVQWGRRWDRFPQHSTHTCLSRCSRRLQARPRHGGPTCVRRK